MKNLIAIAFGLSLAPTCFAQHPQGITVQQPTTHPFGINTVVRAPAGGTMYLGGVQRSASGSISRRGSRASSQSRSAPGASVSVQLIVGSEVDAELERRARLALARNARPLIHGTVAEQAQAAFIARHLGRGAK